VEASAEAAAVLASLRGLPEDNQFGHVSGFGPHVAEDFAEAKGFARLEEYAVEALGADPDVVGGTMWSRGRWSPLPR